MNVIARLEYELAYYDSAVHRFNHYTTRRTPPNILSDNSYELLQYNTTQRSGFERREWFGIVSLFNEISSFVDYSIPSHPCSSTILPLALGIRRVHTFIKYFSPKVTVIARLESELAHYNLTVHYVAYFTTGTTPNDFGKFINSSYHKIPR